MPNRLAGESSPYLRQHADNPVDWLPWGREAFARAAAEDKPVLLSVGYSSCHWCHVMAHESFEDPQVATVLNRDFVSVKVDREERPDVDALYMDAVQALTGRGGWPMTVFLTPDGRPFFGGTYFPKPSFLRLLAAVDDAWRQRRDELLDQAGELTEVLVRSSAFAPAAGVPGLELLDNALVALADAYDADWGGFGSAPKFPQAMNLELVLRAHVSSASADALTVVTTTLDAMASGGIYDHLGGGFARYSTDERWLVPHFEKMLYDQALLARVYLHAWQVTGEARYRQVLDETIGYVLRDLQHPDGGWYSAEDADSEGREGAFYVWTPAELRRVLGAVVGADAAAWYGVTESGNFEGASVLHRPERADLLRPLHIEGARRQLLEARNRRPRPGLDDKVLAEWNGLMLATLAEAAAATGDPVWWAAAIRNGEFLLEQLRVGGRWRRSWQVSAGARHEALAADHAALANAFGALAAATGEARWVSALRDVTDELLDRFWDHVGGGVFTTPDDGERLVARQKDVMDNATPSANALAAHALLRLEALTGERRYGEHADAILRLVADLAQRAPSAFGHYLAAVDHRRTGSTEIVVTGGRPDLVRAAAAPYRPGAVVVWGERFDSPLWEGRPDGYAFVCRDRVCGLPAATVGELEAQLAHAPR